MGMGEGKERGGGWGRGKGVLMFFGLGCDMERGGELSPFFLMKIGLGLGVVQSLRVRWEKGERRGRGIRMRGSFRSLAGGTENVKLCVFFGGVGSEILKDLFYLSLSSPSLS